MNIHNHYLYQLWATALLLFAASGVAEAVPPGRPFQELDMRIATLEQAGDPQNGQSCPAGQVLTGFNTDGTLVCVPGQPMAVDANGVVIGTVIGTRTDLRDNAQLTVLTAQGFQAVVSGVSGRISAFEWFRYFPTNNCTGQLYLRTLPRSVFRMSNANLALYYVPGDAMYVQVGAIAAESWSVRDWGGGCYEIGALTGDWVVTVDFLDNDPAVTGVGDPYPYAPPLTVE
jgi:hypothetical protein